MTRRQRCIIAGIGNEEGNGQVAVNIQQSTFEAVAEFLASQPTLEDIANYRASEAMDERVHALLEKNREDSLSAEEYGRDAAISRAISPDDPRESKSKTTLIGVGMSYVPVALRVTEGISLHLKTWFTKQCREICRIARKFYPCPRLAANNSNARRGVIFPVFMS